MGSMQFKALSNRLPVPDQQDETGGHGTTLQIAQEYAFQRSSPTNTNPNPNIRNPAVKYGGIDPENEDNIHLVDDVTGRELREDLCEAQPQIFRAASEHSSSEPQSATTHTHSESEMAIPSSGGLLQLPSELIDAILSYLNPVEIAVVTRICKTLYRHGEFHWQAHVLSNLPGNRITTPYPFKTFRELYASHDPYWFIPRNKIWFCDHGLTGQLMIVQYDQRRGVIEGYQLLAIRHRDGSEPWQGLADQMVHIHYFEPVVKLHRDKPLIKLDPMKADTLGQDGRRRFVVEQQMPHNGSDPRLSNIILSKPLTDSLLKDTMAARFPYGYVWPPPQIPARHRVGGCAAGLVPLPTRRLTSASPSVWKPTAVSEASDQTFRVRQWMEMGPLTLGVHIGEEMVTWSTLDPVLYTPTRERPWRGIWVGDYSGHGCEFLLINQPDLEDDEHQKPLVRRDNETEAEFEERFHRERVYKGRLEAIKLTGDPNVPRGEYTFIAKDLGEAGFVGVAQEPPFQGARVVKSVGHIAAVGFFNDKYIESQLLLLSHNRLAQYWVGFGHISFFERVDIDRFLVP